MTKKILLNSLAMSVGIVGIASAQDAGTDSVKGMTATIQGCVVDGKDGSYVLTHVVETSGLGAPATDPTLKAMSGASGGGQEAIYWLSSDSAKLIKEHVGHKVEVTGVVTKESTGKVTYKQEAGKSGKDNKVEVEAQGKEAVAKTDRQIKPGLAPNAKAEETHTLPVRRVKVDTVRMLVATCPS